MVATYNIAGKKVPSHYLAIATLTTVIGGVFLYKALAKPSKAAAPVPASAGQDDDVTKAIDEFVKSNGEEKK
ncbi:DEKNAAC100202 [Brettanomyces naardenensis]|uniref:DEKNAAC100203 n=1 Tax=Brettanomyces naardenensis TaxID=13370 RepID=A0A448YG58_BRENA|nr:DEKNAAC100202 [Brettanomyces naardenensis]